ncbi:helix-turn-helix domain-containing protein [Paracoccus sp. SM22M-07]|uniref:helix-turn-helix domain-containing protein n=1 Tax=Paracoccus sp. SM22M-07 TaxID=1520813 RepID=UPI0009F8DDCF|nr:helix-turn-helix domain-containing protein [Paracoccus sp. SM22M-07]
MLKLRLRSKGSSLAQVARNLSVLQSSVTVVSQGYRRSHRIQEAIATELQTTPSDIFPERYTERADISH